MVHIVVLPTEYPKQGENQDISVALNVFLVCYIQLGARESQRKSTPLNLFFSSNVRD